MSRGSWIEHHPIHPDPTAALPPHLLTPPSPTTHRPQPALLPRPPRTLALPDPSHLPSPCRHPPLPSLSSLPPSPPARSSALQDPHALLLPPSPPARSSARPPSPRSRSRQMLPIPISIHLPLDSSRLPRCHPPRHRSRIRKAQARAQGADPTSLLLPRHRSSNYLLV